jgi:hypothetical protein
MDQDLATYVGIDLGGARGKTTAVARLTRASGAAGVMVEEVCARRAGVDPWRDDVLVDYLGALGEGVVVAIDAPLTAPACMRCTEAVCPGREACADAAVVWLRTAGARLARSAQLSDSERIAAVPASSSVRAEALSLPRPQPAQAPSPYVHRCAELTMHHERGLIPRDMVGRGTGPVAARGNHLRRLLRGLGFELNRNLIEVSPRATVRALFGANAARGYKRDADPWKTRAAIVDGLTDLRFALRSRLSKESVLQNDHCFEALLSGYTAYLRARDDWQMDGEAVFADDGWIWAP